jgi:hypothetical protein
MKRLTIGAAMALACTVGLGAQTAKVKSETEIDVKNGKDVTVTGCVERTNHGTGLVLARTEGRDVESSRYMLVGKDDALERRVGQLVEIKGKATDVGDDGKVEIKSKTKVEREDADDRTTKSKTELSGDLDGLPYLGVKSVKVLRDSCY